MKRMRTYFLLAVCIAGCGGAMQAAVPQKDTAYVEDYKNLQVWSLNRLTVDTQKKAIQKYIKQNAKVRIAVRAALIAAATGALAYYLLRDTGPVKGAVVTPLKPEESIVVSQDAFQRMHKEVSAQRQASMIVETALTEKVIALEETIAKANGIVPTKEVIVPAGYGGALVQKGKDVAYGSYGLVKDIGIYFIQNLPATVAACFVNVLILKDVPTLLETLNYLIVRPIRQINHALNIEWFLVSQLKVKKIYLSADRTEYRLGYEKFFDVSLARTISVLPLASDDFERGHYVSSIVTDLNLLSRQLSRVVAFCELRADHIIKNNKVCGKHLHEIASYLFRLTKKFGDDMKHLLASKEHHAKIPAALQEFQFKLIEQLEAFRMYERAAYYDIVPSA